MRNIKEYRQLQTRSIAEACKDQLTMLYVIDCINRYCRGDYGMMCEEDIQANNREAATSCGHIIARYEAFRNLTEDIYIETVFDDGEDITDIDSNNTLIMYCGER